MRKKKRKKYSIALLLLLLLGISVWETRDLEKRKGGTCVTTALRVVCDVAQQTMFPTDNMPQKEKTDSFLEYLVSHAMEVLPQKFFQEKETSYELQTESKLDYDEILALEAGDENYIEEKTGKLVKKKEQEPKESQNKTEEAGRTSMIYDGEKQVEYPIEKLNDFDYLIQNFYRVDATTTIGREELNASEMLSQNLHISEAGDEPKVLIYHTHSRETYEGDLTNVGSVVDVGNILTNLLQETYHIPVLHDTGCYDEVRDAAYTKAAPALEKILSANPSIEVVIDLHRDGVAEGTHLVTEMNGKPTAQIMFFNGLSRTTAGAISYLPNENLKTNLAFSFQMQLTANEYYPNFSRCIYLKGYRYNMHYCPKTLLVEVGAQTNTYEEAKNAMVPLADILQKVIK